MTDTKLPRPHEPIVAIATASGRGAVGIVRLSGRQLLGIAKALTGVELEPRHATLASVRDAKRAVIDTGLVIHFPAPQSYTGEDVLELQMHGGPVVLQMVMRRCLELGASRGLRLAEPGEFTLRAFLNGKLDLAQAEAVSDLIDASTESAARSATRSLDGVFSRRIDAVAAQLIEMRTLVEASLDFPEDDVDIVRRHDVVNRLAQVIVDVDVALDGAQQGRLLRDGLTVVLAGQPNAGKSSLLNRLAGADVAIVSPIAGTTRDRIAQTIQIDGVPLHVVDTAGLRQPGAALDDVERMGIERTWDAVGKADAVLFVRDLSRVGDATHDAADAAILHELAARGCANPTRIVHVMNKADRVHAHALDTAETAHVPSSDDEGPLHVSALTGQGLERLRRVLLARAGWHAAPEGTFMARERHVQALHHTAEHLEAARAHLEPDQPPLELLAEALRLAHQSLASITGDFAADDLLGRIFGRFCIGK
jgi:tRNA modification GTPase